MKGALRRTAALLALGLAAAPAGAQVQPKGIPVGRGTFYPSLEANYTVDDNLFQRAVDPVQADYLAVGPNLAYSLNLSRSRLELSWEPRYRKYADDVIPSRSTQVFEGEWQLETRGGSSFTIRDSFENGILEFQDFAGGETVFAGQDFNRNQFDITYGRDLGPRQALELGVFSGFVKFKGSDQLRFYDFSDRGVSGSWILKLSDELNAYVEARAAENKQDRNELITFSPPVIGDPVLIPDPAGENFDQVSARLGLEGKIQDRLQVRAEAGWARLLFIDSSQSDFDGVIADIDLRIPLTRTLGLQLRGLRQPFPSNFNAANYFVNESAGLFLEWRTPRRLTLIVGMRRQRNSYSDPIITDLDGNPNTGIDFNGNDILPDPDGGFVAGVVREDRISRLEGSLEFAFIPGRLQGFVRVFDESRTSNLAFAQFDRTAVTAGLRFGWFAP